MRGRKEGGPGIGEVRLEISEVRKEEGGPVGG